MDVNSTEPEEIMCKENEHAGDKMNRNKEENTTRFCFQNTNGLNLTEDGGQLKEFYVMM